ncbi:uncharacterized protein LOC103512414 [Diaphorina citri]|uniref:Uncharacterized protein LOC103512414 n=1 Tax=Diaphorina citri TaxID=121845 RepID=A0A1S3D6L9_DIACI|nr:uncharacterized protein LOC103512414 [Diaphorina citri]
MITVLICSHRTEKVRGVWCLDHNRWSDAYQHLKKASKYTRVPTWLHYSAVILMLLKREKQLAYQYTCDFQPECCTQNQVKYCEAYEYKDAVKRKHASSLIAAAKGSSAQETADMQKFIWRTDKQVDYMYTRCVPQLVKEEYQSGKRTAKYTERGVSEHDQSRKRGPDTSVSLLENSTKRGRYAFDFSFDPVPTASGDDTNLSLQLPSDPNISALLHTPYVHKKSERPPVDPEAAPGSAHKPNKSLLKTPGSASGSVKKALSFASLEVTPDEEVPNGPAYSKVSAKHYNAYSKVREKQVVPV